MQLKPRNYVARAQQSGAGSHSKHANRKRAEEKRAGMHEAEAARHNELHSLFFNTPHVPVQEIRKSLDAKLITYHLKSLVEEEDNDANG